jgi:hypothetical protein
LIAVTRFPLKVTSAIQESDETYTHRFEREFLKSYRGVPARLRTSALVMPVESMRSVSNDVTPSESFLDHAWLLSSPEGAGLDFFPAEGERSV